MNVREKFLLVFPDSNFTSAFGTLGGESLKWAGFLNDVTSHLDDARKDKIIRLLFVEKKFEDLNFLELERLIHEMV